MRPIKRRACSSSWLVPRRACKAAYDYTPFGQATQVGGDSRGLVESWSAPVTGLGLLFVVLGIGGALLFGWTANHEGNVARIARSAKKRTIFGGERNHGSDEGVLRFTLVLFQCFSALIALIGIYVIVRSVAR